MRRWQASASSHPPPSAKPFTAAITGLRRKLDPAEHALPQPADLDAVHRPHLRQLGDVGAGHERLFAHAGQDHAAHVVARGDLVHRRRQLADGLLVERVQLVRPVDGQRGDAVLDIEREVAVFGHGTGGKCESARVRKCGVARRQATRAGGAGQRPRERMNPPQRKRKAPQTARGFNHGRARVALGARPSPPAPSRKQRGRGLMRAERAERPRRLARDGGSPLSPARQTARERARHNSSGEEQQTPVGAGSNSPLSPAQRGRGAGERGPRRTPVRCSSKRHQASVTAQPHATRHSPSTRHEPVRAGGHRVPQPRIHSPTPGAITGAPC